MRYLVAEDYNVPLMKVTDGTFAAFHLKCHIICDQNMILLNKKYGDKGLGLACLNVLSDVWC